MIDVPNLPSLPILGREERFPVRRIYCVAKNYAAHVREMGDDPERVPPSFFDKPWSALSTDGDDVIYPRETHDLHHEVELVLALAEGARGAMSPAEAGRLVFGAACGIDLTRRDLQSRAKAKGGPWDLAKGFPGAAPVGAITPIDALPRTGAIQLWVNGTLRQSSDLTHMIWDAGEVLSQLSRYEDLRAGDLVFTGTPEGVGPVEAGDRLYGRIEGVGEIAVAVR